MIEIRLIPEKEFARVYAADIDKYAKLQLLSDMCRANALATVKRAGSGHLGSSLSSLDIVSVLYFSEMNIAEVGISWYFDPDTRLNPFRDAMQLGLDLLQVRLNHLLGRYKK